jgi:hypothetical protein
MKYRYLVLYILLFFALACAGAVTMVELNYRALGLDTPIFNFTATSWLSLVAILAAVSGWITTSLITLHNARRQHTINVLLQSRLSQAYQQRLRDAISKYPTIKKITKVKDGDWRDPKKWEALEGIKYMLNYFEFVAIGIRQGDLDEKTLKMSLRGIVLTLTQVADAYIKYARGELKENDGQTSPHSYEHVLWLKARWTKPSLASRARNFVSRCVRGFVS